MEYTPFPFFRWSKWWWWWVSFFEQSSTQTKTPLSLPEFHGSRRFSFPRSIPNGLFPLSTPIPAFSTRALPSLPLPSLSATWFAIRSHERNGA